MIAAQAYRRQTRKACHHRDLTQHQLRLLMRRLHRFPQTLNGGAHVLVVSADTSAVELTQHIHRKRVLQVLTAWLGSACLGLPPASPFKWAVAESGCLRRLSVNCLAVEMQLHRGVGGRHTRQPAFEFVDVGGLLLNLLKLRMDGAGHGGAR
jgi:hypothetical protein